MAEALRPEEVRNERAHEPGFTDAGGEREAEGRELPLEVLHRLEFVADDGECSRGVGPFLQSDQVTHAGEDVQGLPLRFAQTQPVADGGDVGVHSASESSKRVGPAGTAFLPDRGAVVTAGSGRAAGAKFLISKL